MSVERHEMWEEDTAAYVLRALSDEEHTRFVRHLRECHVCRDEVDRLQFAVDALPRSVEPLSAPAGLKATIMAEVESDVREQQPAPSLGARLRERFSRVPALRPRVASATAAVLLLVGVAGGFGLSQVTDGEERSVDAAFDGTRVASGSGNLVIGGNDKAGGTLRVHGMPKLRANETYQVWLQRDGEVIPKAMFSVSDQGDGLTAVDDLDGADAVMVTREPAGGARAPSGPPLVTVKL
ncbi:MAG TPA: anti-sigma factor [Thermoleophilaceae bacterium]|nr:anti-sigma factor [Thermoleophilaceae bacterium]